MNITSKSRYALKIMMDLAELPPDDLAQRGDIANRQGIPLDYMDHVLSRLREAGLIASTRGRSGGYKLSRGPATISMLEIFTTVEDAFQPVQCLDGGHGCVALHVCNTRDAWGEISAAISRSLSGIILADIVAKKVSARGLESPDAGPIHECKAPRRRAMNAELS